MNDKTAVTAAGMIRAAAYQLCADFVGDVIEGLNNRASSSVDDLVTAFYARKLLPPIAKSFATLSADELAGEPHTAKPRPPAPRPTPRLLVMAELRRPLSTREVLLFCAGMQCASLTGWLIGMVMR